MSSICPAVMATTDDPHEFREIMEKVGTYATRVQIDLMDGDFAPHHNISPDAIWWPEGVAADVHLMYRYPETVIDALIALRPNLIIVHAEASGDLMNVLRRVKEADIKNGMAFLRTTDVYDHRDLVEQVDHVMLFGGELGGDGHGELGSLEGQATAVRAIKPGVELGWDGGANSSNVERIRDAGVDVIVVGAALRHAEDPAAEYERLQYLAGRH